MSEDLRAALREACAEIRKHNASGHVTTARARIEAWERLANEPEPGSDASDDECTCWQADSRHLDGDGHLPHCQWKPGGPRLPDPVDLVATEECARCGAVWPVDVACRGCQANAQGLLDGSPGDVCEPCDVASSWAHQPGDEPPPRPCCHRVGDWWCTLPDGHPGPHDAPAPRELPAVDFGPLAATTTRRGQP